MMKKLLPLATTFFLVFITGTQSLIGKTKCVILENQTGQTLFCAIYETSRTVGLKNTQIKKLAQKAQKRIPLPALKHGKGRVLYTSTRKEDLKYKLDLIGAHNTFAIKPIPVDFGQPTVLVYREEAGLITGHPVATRSCSKTAARPLLYPIF